MRTLATWMGVFCSALFSAVGIIGGLLFKMQSPSYHKVFFPMPLVMLGCTLWAAVYLLRAKGKGAHEKIGFAVNIYWLIVAVLQLGIVSLLFGLR
jgi:hypothetical protein